MKQYIDDDDDIDISDHDEYQDLMYYYSLLDELMFGKVDIDDEKSEPEEIRAG